MIQNSTPRQIIGALKVNYLVYFNVLITLGAPIYTYYMATSTGEKPPFPHKTITNTACIYPQAQFFRWL